MKTAANVLPAWCLLILTVATCHAGLLSAGADAPVARERSASPVVLARDAGARGPAGDSDQRRAGARNPEDPLVLEWLKLLQDRSSADRRLLPAQEGDDAAQTFNNALVALAFMVKQERERAERILDYFAEATVEENNDASLQNFFYRGEARGFFQEVSLASRHNVGRGTDRWMGDMAWLLCACKYHQMAYQSARYTRLVTLLHDLLVSYYRPAMHGGYIQHGWRKGDAYKHEADGHHEGNIDCFAVLRLCGEDSLACNIRQWLDNALRGVPDLPLDLYTWRTLAFGPASDSLLRIPEEDPRYRKSIVVRGHRVTGFYHAPDASRENIWTDGVGHMACAYQTCGSAEKGFFYANQLDSLMVERRIGGVVTHALPYTANRSGGYEWVDTTKGFTSCAAWYILAMNGVNPFRPRSTGVSLQPVAASSDSCVLFPPSPDPCTSIAHLRYVLPRRERVTLEICTPSAQAATVLVHATEEPGAHTYLLDTSHLSSGIYFYTLRTATATVIRSLVVVHDDGSAPGRISTEE